MQKRQKVLWLLLIVVSALLFKLVGTSPEYRITSSRNADIAIYVALILTAVLSFVSWRMRLRETAVRKYAEGRGYTYKGLNLEEVKARLDNFIFIRPEGVSNLVAGSAGAIRFALFDYQAPGNDGPSTDQSILMLTADRNISAFHLRPRASLDRLIETFANSKSDLPAVLKDSFTVDRKPEGHPPVSFSEDLIAILLANKDLEICGKGDTLVVQEGNNKLSTNQFDAFLEKGFALFESLAS